MGWSRSALAGARTPCTAIQAAFDAGVRKVTEAMKRLPMEVLDESVWKRFDSEDRLFWNMNTPDRLRRSAPHLESRRIDDRTKSAKLD